VENHKKDDPPTDRRIERTRRLLRDALVSLLLERDWGDISVRDVCDRADVGRSTFYVHFADKEELLVGGLDDLRDVLRKQRRARARDDERLGFVHGLVVHAHEHQRLFRALLTHRTGHVVQNRFRRMVLDLFREDLASSIPSRQWRDAMAHYAGGALLELLSWWLSSGDCSTPDAIEESYRRLTLPVLERARAMK